MKKNWMSTKYLVLFFVLTLAWTWICGFIPVLFGFTGTGAGTFVRAAQLASIRQMSGQESRGPAGEYQADERAGVARLSWRVSGR